MHPQSCCGATVDSCGVCNGGDATCILRTVLRIVAREDLEIEVLVGRLKSELGKLLASFFITPGHIHVDISGMEQVSRRRLLAIGSKNLTDFDLDMENATDPSANDTDTNATNTAFARRAAAPAPVALPPVIVDSRKRPEIEDGWVEVDVPFSISPPDGDSGLEVPLVGGAADFLLQLTAELLHDQPEGLRILSAVEVDVGGECGNGVCEYGEMTLPSGEVGSCPQDCPIIAPRALAVDNSSQVLPMDIHGNGTGLHQTCPDIATSCAGDDANACYMATVASTTPECLGLDVSHSLEMELPPVNAGTIVPCPIDSSGECCALPAMLDAAGNCCRGDKSVDDCGVCGGERASCATVAVMRVAAPQSLEVKTFVGNVQQAVADVLSEYRVKPESVQVGVNHMVRLAKATDCGMLEGGMVLPPGVVAASRKPSMPGGAGNNQGKDSTALTGPESADCRLGDEWLRLEFPVSVMPEGSASVLAPNPQQVSGVCLANLSEGGSGGEGERRQVLQGGEGEGASDTQEGSKKEALFFSGGGGGGGLRE